MYSQNWNFLKLGLSKIISVSRSSIVFIGFSILFIKKISEIYDTTLKVENGSLEFEYEQISSIHTPHDETQIISRLKDLQNVVEGHNFNPKHTYIYARFDGDNKHAYTLKSIDKTTSRLYITFESRELPKNEKIEKLESMHEYMVDILGNLDEKTVVQLEVSDYKEELKQE